MKKQIYYIIFTALLFLQYGITKAQTPADSNVVKLAAHLSVSPERAKQIAAAYNYRRTEIVALMHNQTLRPQEKTRQLKQLFAARGRQLSAVLSPAEQQRLYQNDTVLKARLQAQTAAIKQRWKQQVARNPNLQPVQATSPSNPQQP